MSRGKSITVRLTRVAVLLVLAGAFSMSGCGPSRGGDPQLLQNTRMDLMDWHITGFWVINCPVAWVKVTNFNSVPIKDLVLQYNTYDAVGNPLDEGTCDIIDGTVPAGEYRNFIELYLGLVSLYSERLSVKLVSVKGG